MQTTTSFQDLSSAFAKRSARAWQNFFDAQGLLPDITLSPEQISVVQQEENQMLINGSAGSGKSLTLIYKLLKVMDQENQHRRILYCSFNTTLIEDAKKRIKQSEKYHDIKDKHTLHLMTFHNAAAGILNKIGVQNSQFQRVDIRNLRRNEESIYRRTYALVERYMSSEEYKRLPPERQLYQTHKGTFLMEEILWMKANGFITSDQYLNCERAGRGNNPRLTREQRHTVFTLFEQYHEMLKRDFNDHLDLEDYALLIVQYMGEIPDSLKYDYIFVDEVQDLQAMQLKALIALNKKSIVVSGDPKQRIYKRSPFSYRDLGLHIEGRKNKTLRTNYRSTKQIMELASTIQFLDTENDRMDNQKFVREGDPPSIYYFNKAAKLSQHLIDEIKGIQSDEPGASIAIIHRHDDDQNGVNQCPVFQALNRNFDVITTEKYGKRFDLDSIRKPVFYTDAFSVKGLEFDYIFLIHFDREHYPNKKKIDALDHRSGNSDKFSSNYQNDYDAILNDEKKVLYVALTRAKKSAQLLFTGDNHMKVSPFIRDFKKELFHAHGFKASIYCE